MKILKMLKFALLLLSITSCQMWNGSSNQYTSENPQEVISRTVLLDSEDWKEFPEVASFVKLPTKMLTIFKVSRSFAETRHGPSSSFPLTNELLIYETQLIELDHSGVWRKVIKVDGLESVGWVHQKALSRDTLKKSYVTIPVNKFKMLRSTEKISEIFDYPNSFERKVKIPKNTPFLKLSSSRDSVFVWIPQSNSVAWIPAQKVL